MLYQVMPNAVLPRFCKYVSQKFFFHSVKRNIYIYILIVFGYFCIV